jgi:hypothetical protein
LPGGVAAPLAATFAGSLAADAMAALIAAALGFEGGSQSSAAGFAASSFDGSPLVATASVVTFKGCLSGDDSSVPHPATTATKIRLIRLILCIALPAEGSWALDWIVIESIIPKPITQPNSLLFLFSTASFQPNQRYMHKQTI